MTRPVPESEPVVAERSVPLEVDDDLKKDVAEAQKDADKEGSR